MPTFNDLEFEDHPIGSGQRAVLLFKNGYGVSVITGDRFYTATNTPYEVAIVDKELNIQYKTGIADDVIGFQTKEQVTDIMHQVYTLANKPAKRRNKKNVQA